MTTNIRILLALTLVHFTGDFYSSFINPLFPLFVEKLDLSLTQVGIIAGTIRIMAFIIQPTTGYLVDRYQTRVFIFAGLALVVTCIPLSGIAANFWLLLGCVALGSIGSAMFHPSVTGMIPLYAGRHAGFSMSIFNTGGTLAFGVGPLFITWYVASFGLVAMPLTMVFGVVLTACLFTVIPRPQSEGLRDFGFLGAIRQSLGDAWKPVSLIWLVMFLRAIVGQSFLTFIPVYYVQQGFSVISAGAIYSLFTLAGTVSGLLSGHISDRIGFKPVLLFIFTLMTPALWLLLQLEGRWVYLGAVIAGGFVLAPLPLGVTMAQTLAPRGRSMIASLMMGFAYGLGGLITPLTGRLADHFAIAPVLTWIAVIPALTVAIIAALPKTRTNAAG